MPLIFVFPEVRVTANSSCTLPTVPPRLRGVAPPTRPITLPNTLPAGKRAPPPYRDSQMDMSEHSKSITRLLQHSILQLCNEHVGYSHKLQILGVLCMTVDDEQHELVVKVNNTLKRVNPPQVPSVKDAKMPPQILQPAIAPVAPPAMAGYGTPADHLLYNGMPRTEEARTASPSQSPRHQALGSTPRYLAHISPQHQAHDNSGKTIDSNTNTPNRKSHGRKGAKPVKVQHVFDEGEICSDDEDQNVLTVIPTDPDSFDMPSLQQSLTPKSLLKGVQGSARRKSTGPYRNNTADESHMSGATERSISAVRALLLGRAAMSSTPQDLSTSRSGHNADYSRNSPPRGLTLPVFVAPQMNSEDRDGLENGLRGDESPTNLSVSDASEQRAGSISPSALDRELLIKEEPDDFSFTGYSNNNNSSSGSHEASLMDNSITQDSSPQDLSQHLASIQNMQNYAHMNGSLIAPSPVLAHTLDGLPSQLPYSISFAPHKHSDSGLSIQYTANGPITVGSNGKNMSQQNRNTKVKDIILYDDSSPLHEQRGNRIETDYMLDAFGMEGSRKRRRRNADESLTSEEIAEYLGSVDLQPQMFKCKYCTDELHDLTQYLQHTLTMHHCYICHQCGKSFTTKSSLLRHRPIHTGMRRFACSICKKTFYRKDKCKAHIKRHLGETGEKAEVEHCDQLPTEMAECGPSFSPSVPSFSPTTARVGESYSPTN